MIKSFPASLLSALLPLALVTSAFGQDDTDRAAPLRSMAIEGDAAAYFLKGYSGIGRVTFGNGLNIALGTGRYNVPGFVMERDSNYDAARWKATAESIQVFRLGYRFRGAMRSGPVIDGIAINQKWRLRSETLGGETKFRQIGAGLSGGYYIHIGRHFYIYPTASLTRNWVYSGQTTIGGLQYKVSPTQFNGSVHVGWEWGF